ncbi:MAG: FecR domain-containing protein, partial [Verrucomicrobia bacterium]|nr:FecR domain-containing protein [Leptolyngbya sp. ES-bin-22]
MSHKFFLIVTLSLLSMGMSPQRASADTPLTRATVQALRNQVQLIFKNRVARAARNADTMTPGDSLATARQSFAELRFNDSSLARIGERALFQFVPNTRNFYLGNGTALLLIPPGQGRTNVRTPNAAAGIRGSALFVRYNEDTNTTIVGALTNSRIEVSNGDSPQAQTLKAGQMAVIIQNQIVQIYNFDLNTFYQTSELVKDLDLPLSNSTPNADPGIAAVQAETSQAAREQAPLTGQVSENPTFVSLTPPPGVQAAVTPNPLGTTTPIPSGFDRGTARQTIDTSQPSQPGIRTPSTPDIPESTGTAAPSFPPSAAPVRTIPGTAASPITPPSVPPAVQPPISTPPPAPAPNVPPAMQPPVLTPPPAPAPNVP